MTRHGARRPARFWGRVWNWKTGPSGLSAALILAAAVLLMMGPVFLNPGRICMINPDWEEVYFHQAAARECVLQGKAVPLWSPHVNGGFPLASHPHNPSFSLLLPIILAAGEVWAPRINIFLVFAVGVAGMALFLSRCAGFSRWGTLFGALVYACAGWLPARLISGNYYEIFYYLFPLLAYCLFRATQDRRFLFFAVLLLYQMIVEAKFVFPIMVLFLALICVLWRDYFSGPERTDGRGERPEALVLAVLFALLMSAMKIYLLLRLLKIEDRSIDYAIESAARKMTDFKSIILWLLWSLTDYNNMRPDMVETIYNNPSMLGVRYVGCGLGAVFFALAAFVMKPKKYWAPFCLLVLAAVLSLSMYSTGYVLFPLRHLFIFRSIYNTWKYFNYFILFFVCVLSAGFVDQIFSTPRTRLVRWGFVACFTAAAAFPALANHRLTGHLFMEKVPALKESKHFYNVFNMNTYYAFKSGIGVICWYSAIHLPTRVAPKYFNMGGWLKKNPAYRREVYLEGGKGTLVSADLDFNAMSAAVRLDAPDTVVFNQNYDSAWQCGGGKVENRGGLAAVRLDTPGSHLVRLFFRPAWSVFWGCVSLVSFLVLAAGCFVSPRAKKHWLSRKPRTPGFPNL